MCSHKGARLGRRPPHKRGSVSVCGGGGLGECGGDFAGGEDGVDMNGGGAVAVVDVGIDDDSALDGFVVLKAADGDSNVVDSAKAFAVVGISVVKAAANIAGEAIVKCGLAGEDRTASG